MSGSDHPSPPAPESRPPLELSYQTPPPWGNAPLLVRLAAIFAFVTVGSDVLHVLMAGAITGGWYYLLTHWPVPPAGAPAGAPVMPAPPSMMIGWTYALMGVLSLLVIPFKLVGAVKLLRRGTNAWSWGLAAAVLECIALWQAAPCCVFVVLPLGAGVYTIIILCFAHVRRYLEHTATS